MALRVMDAEPVAAAVASERVYRRPEDVPELGHEEAAEVATVALERFLALIESLTPEDWSRPTECTEWDVRQVVSHETGAAASYARWRDFRRQMSPLRQRRHRRPGDSMVDRVNAIQVTDRADRAPAELIAELREVGPRAIATRRKLPRLLRAIPVPMPEPIGRVTPIGYLTDVIYGRDMWMHRLDICRATGREMVLTARHDGRVIDLVMREAAYSIAPTLGGASVVYTLTGFHAGDWLFGGDREPSAEIQIDSLDLNVLASERVKPEAMLADGRIVVSGDRELAERVLAATVVAY